MLNEAQISLTGYVATQPITRTVKTGAMNLSMRVAWTPRWQDRVTGEWVDGATSYVTVICWRKLASNVAICVRKGDPVMVKGRLSVRTYDSKDGAPRTAVEVEASSVGHDLTRGVASFQRVRPQTGMTASEFAATATATHEDGAEDAEDQEVPERDLAAGRPADVADAAYFGGRVNTGRSADRYATATDRDQAGTDRDQAASDRDQAGTDEDPAADDRDQAAGDRDSAASERDPLVTPF